VIDVVVGDMRRVVRVTVGITYNVLVGPHGAVQFVYARTYAENERGMRDAGDVVKNGESVIGFDVGYHAYERRYEDQYSTECEWLLGQRNCFYDGLSGPARDWLLDWQDHNIDDDEWVWGRLGRYYERVFM